MQTKGKQMTESHCLPIAFQKPLRCCDIWINPRSTEMHCRSDWRCVICRFATAATAVEDGICCCCWCSCRCCRWCRWCRCWWPLLLRWFCWFLCCTLWLLLVLNAVHSRWLLQCYVIMVVCLTFVIASVSPCTSDIWSNRDRNAKTINMTGFSRARCDHRQTSRKNMSGR